MFFYGEHGNFASSLRGKIFKCHLTYTSCFFHRKVERKVPIAVSTSKLPHLIFTQHGNIASILLSDRGAQTASQRNRPDCQKIATKKQKNCYDSSANLGKTSMKKKTFSFRHCPNEGGGLPMPEFFGPFSKSAFLVLLYLPPLPPSEF